MAFTLKYAAHLGVRSVDEPMFLHHAGSADPVANIRVAADLGFAAIEDNSFKRRPRAQQEAIGRALRDHGMQMGCMVGATETMMTTAWHTDSDAARDALRAEMEASIAAAQITGGRFVVIAGAADPKLPSGFQRMVMTDHLKRLGEMAHRAGLVICVEQISRLRFPGMILHHIDDALAMVKAVDCPAVQLVFDTYHVHTMDSSLIENIRRCRDHIAVVQISDSPGRMEPGAGEINYVNVLRALRANGFDGIVELECFTEKPGLEGEWLLLERLRAIDAAL